MVTTVDTEKVMHQTIFSYLSENVWNNPLMECRRNIVPMPYNKCRAAVNTVDLGCQSVDLPYKSHLTIKKSFYVFAAAKCCMGGLVVDTELPSLKTNLKDDYIDGWLPLDVYLNNRPFDLRFHGINGEWLYRNEIYIKNHPYQDLFLIAVEVKMARKILGNSYNMKNVLLSVYYDSDNDLNDLKSTSKEIICYHPGVSDTDMMGEAYEAYANLSTELIEGMHVSPRDQVMYFIDGRESVPGSMDDIKPGQYIEIVKDPDIIYNDILNLTKVGENNIYRSELDDTYKYIVHIPKRVNPENYIITHNTCDMFLRPVNTVVSSDERLKGLFIHRFNTSKRNENGQLVDHMITQITHNDFGISEKLVMTRAGEDALDTTEFVLRTVIRKHNKTKKLLDDANFIKLLYNFNDDEQIIKILTGYGDPSLSFWKADNLERSNFSQMLVNLPVLTNNSNTQYYMDALGYFNTLCVVTPRVTHGVVSRFNTNTFQVSIPSSMLSCDRIGLLIYINGSKVPETVMVEDATNTLKEEHVYTYSREYQYLTVSLSSHVTIKENDKISFELFDDDNLRGKIVEPTTDNRTFTMFSLMDFDVYEIIDEAPEEDYYTKNYINTHTSYALCDKSEIFQGDPIVNITTGTYTYVFDPNMYGRKFLFLSKVVYTRFNEKQINSEAVGGNTIFGGVTFTLGEGTATCTDMMHSGVFKLEVHPLPGYESDEIFSIPIINKDWNTIVFMNNKELVRDIDYSYKPIYGKSGIQSMVWFFNNISYLKTADNTFELYLTSDAEFTKNKGFMHNRYTYNNLSNTKHFNYGVVEDVVPYIYWFNRLCTSAIDGINRPDMKQDFGYLKVFNECRQGGLYLTRGFVPFETDKFVSKYRDIEDDLKKLHAIAEYRKDNAPVLDPELEVIPYSHHIASITMNAVVKDVLTGRKQLAYESDPFMMLKQLTEYDSLKKYDTAMSGIARELTISKAGYIRANNTYQLEQAGMSGINRKWVNKSNNIIIWWNCEDDKHRWEIALIDPILGKVAYYYAKDPDGTKNPWELEWEYVLDANGSPVDAAQSLPVVTSGSVDLKYMDLFPSYSSDLKLVMNDITLRQAMRALFPVNDIKDGDTTV